MTFKDLNIIPPILKALENEKYEIPTPIQEQAIPPAIAGRDLLGCAQTGTGKTAAFAVPTLQRLYNPEDNSRIRQQPRRIRSLVLTPTRELAMQIYESFCAYGRYTGLRACVIFGGVSQKPQEQVLERGVDILVATPGRLGDLMNQRLIELKHVEILILDEADRMLDMGFIHDVRKIIAQTPAKKQTLFFSATMPPEIANLSGTLLNNPVKLSITPESPTVDAIRQSVYLVDKVNKRHLLLHLLNDPRMTSALVFTRTKHGADRVTRDLERGNVQAQAIHGNKSQNARQQALANFKNKTTRVLVATDIAARGIDIEELSHVINFDLPEIPESYIHRIGRTGRAGHDGIAISFCDHDEKRLLRDIEKLCGRTIPVIKEQPYPLQPQSMTVQPGQDQPGQQDPQDRRNQQNRRQQQPAAAQRAESSGQFTRRREGRPVEASPRSPAATGQRRPDRQAGKATR